MVHGLSSLALNAAGEVRRLPAIVLFLLVCLPAITLRLIGEQIEICLTAQRQGRLPVIAVDDKVRGTRQFPRARLFHASSVAFRFDSRRKFRIWSNPLSTDR